MMTAYVVTGDDARSHQEPGGKPDIYQMQKGDVVIIDNGIFLDNIMWRHSPLFGWIKASDLKAVTHLLPGDKQRDVLIARLLAIRQNVDESLKMLGYKEKENNANGK